MSAFTNWYISVAIWAKLFLMIAKQVRIINLTEQT